MEQCPSWEADSDPASQEIPCLLWNPKIRYNVHKSPPLVHVLRFLDDSVIESDGFFIVMYFREGHSPH
jgi:hypothetical protein